MNKKMNIKSLSMDILLSIFSGIVVGTAFFFFQNSNGFAPGGVGGLATVTHYLLNGVVDWGILMIAFNLPIFILVSVFIDKKLGIMLSIYLIVQSFIPRLYEFLDFKPYCELNNGGDFNIIFACIATGVISGFGFSVMLRRFGASGGTYAISALIRRRHPALNMASFSFAMDSSVVAIAFFVYGMKITPVVCTLLNLFIASIIVDKGLNGLKNGYKFEIVTDEPELIANEIMEKLKHGVTSIKVQGMHSHSEKFIIMCIINKRQIGDMMRIIKNHSNTFASFEKVNEVFGNFKRNV